MKLVDNGNSGFNVDLTSAASFYPFGMEIPGRTWNNGTAYRYGWGGHENDNEIKGDGNSITTHFRLNDPRVGRWFSLDPVTHFGQSPYVSMDNDPVNRIDPNGALDNPLTPGSSSSGGFFAAIWGALSQIGSAILKAAGEIGKMIANDIISSEPATSPTGPDNSNQPTSNPTTSPTSPDNSNQSSNVESILTKEGLEKLSPSGINFNSEKEFNDFKYLFGFSDVLEEHIDHSFISRVLLNEYAYDFGTADQRFLMLELWKLVVKGNSKGIKFLYIATNHPLVTTDGGKTYHEDPDIKFNDTDLNGKKVGGVFRKFHNVHVLNYSKDIGLRDVARLMLHEAGHSRAKIWKYEDHGDEFWEWVHKVLRYFDSIEKNIPKFDNLER